MSDKKALATAPDTSPAAPSSKASVGGFLSLILVICFFSGVFGQSDTFSVFSFSQLLGQFGVSGDSGTNFVGTGGTALRQGFLFALSLIPSVMLALGVVGIAEYFGAFPAAQCLLTPLMRPLFGLPGGAGLALITSLQSSDAGGAMTRELYESHHITDRERTIFGAFQFSAGSAVTVYLTAGTALFHGLTVSYLIPLGVILFYKVVGTNLMRLYLHCLTRKEEKEGNGHA